MWRVRSCQRVRTLLKKHMCSVISKKYKNIIVEKIERVAVITINRANRKNAVDKYTAAELRDAFAEFDTDTTVDVAVLTGANDTFCAGYDLKSLSMSDVDDIEVNTRGPMGPTRMLLSKPCIAAVEGHCVAGGLELALWCDLRVAGEGSEFGVFCRTWGVPLIDGGTVRLPRLIGQSRAMDMILTGRAVGVTEALEFGLVNRSVPRGQALPSAIELAKSLVTFPQRCLRADRLSSYRQYDFNYEDALQREGSLGSTADILREAIAGAQQFSAGARRQEK